MKAIFLSAGMGTRMRPYTEHLPKPLLEIEKGKTLLDVQIERLQDTSIHEIIIVTGYEGKLLEEYVKKKYPKKDVKCIYNPFYKEANNLVSLWFARHNMNEDFIVINGDNLFQSSVVNTLIKHPRKDEVVMVVDEKEQYDEDDMKVVIQEGKVQNVNKQIPLTQANGESIGMIRFTGTGRTKLKMIMRDMLFEEASKNVFWLASVQRMIKQHNNVIPFYIKPDQWEEVDFHNDYDRARMTKERFYFLNDLDKRHARVHQARQQLPGYLFVKKFVLKVKEFLGLP